MGVLTKFEFLFWGFEMAYPTIFEGFESRGVFMFPTIWKIEGVWKFKGGQIDEGFRVFFKKIQGLKVTYPPIFEGYDVSVVFIFT